MKEASFTLLEKILFIAFHEEENKIYGESKSLSYPSSMCQWLDFSE